MFSPVRLVTVMANDGLPLNRAMELRSLDQPNLTAAMSLTRTILDPSARTTTSPNSSGSLISPVSLMEKLLPEALREPPGMLRCWAWMALETSRSEMP